MSLLGGLLLSSIKVDPVLDICKKVTVHHSFLCFFLFLFFFSSILVCKCGKPSCICEAPVTLMGWNPLSLR